MSQQYSEGVGRMSGGWVVGWGGVAGGKNPALRHMFGAAMMPKDTHTMASATSVGYRDVNIYALMPKSC